MLSALGGSVTSESLSTSSIHKPLMPCLKAMRHVPWHLIHDVFLWWMVTYVLQAFSVTLFPFNYDFSRL